MMEFPEPLKINLFHLSYDITGVVAKGIAVIAGCLDVRGKRGGFICIRLTNTIVARDVCLPVLRTPPIVRDLEYPLDVGDEDPRRLRSPPDPPCVAKEDDIVIHLQVFEPLFESMPGLGLDNYIGAE